MKRYFALSLITLALVSSLNAQGLTDALKYGDTDILGTARYMSLAGSMGAVGGDPTAIVDNPGALGVYRGSELSFTLNATPSHSIANSNNEQSKRNDFFFNFNQLSYLFSLQSGRDKGYVSSNFSFTYNRLRDFHRTVGVKDYSTSSMTNLMASMTDGFGPSSVNEDNEYVPYISVLGYQGYLIDPMAAPDTAFYTPYADRANTMAYRGIESGRLEEYTISYAANIGHYLYLGASVGFQNLSYKLMSESGEIYDNGADMVLLNSFSTTGVGYLFRFGAIARPVSFLRLGFSVQTPVYFTMRDEFYGDINTYGTKAQNTPLIYSTPISTSYYGYNSPLKMQASVGFVINKLGFINIDYQYSDYRGMRLRGDNDESIFSAPHFQFENNEIGDYARAQHMIKAGAEFRVASQFSFRAGFAYRTPNVGKDATRSLMDNTTRTDMEYMLDRGSLYASGGLGYRYNGFGIDITYGYSQRNQDFYAFQRDAQWSEADKQFTVQNPTADTFKPTAKVRTLHHNIALTLLYKF